MREDVTVRIGATDEQLQRQLQKTRLTARNAGSAIGREFGGIDRAARAAAVGVKILVAAMAGLTVLGGVVREFAKFETELSKIKGLVGVAADAVDDMGQQILALAPEVGRSPQELAEALFFITSAGLTGSDAMDALRASARAATAGLGETRSVADAVTSAMNAYATAGLSAEQATDVLVATVREGKLEASELSSAIGQVLAVAENASVRFDEVGASIAALTRVGIGTSEAVTGLRAVLSALTRESKEGSDILAGMGISFEYLRESIRDRGLLAALTDLRARVGGNDTALVKILGSVEAVNTVLALTGANADQVTGIYDRMADSTGALDDAFDAAADTVEFQMGRAMAGINASMIAFGDALSKNRGPLAWFADQMGRLPTVIQQVDFLLRNLSTTLQVLADNGSLPGLDINFPLGTVAEYRKRLEEVQRLEASIAAERAKLAGMDPDMAARNAMTGPLAGLLDELNRAQSRLEDARQRYAAESRSNVPSRDLGHLAGPTSPLSAVTDEIGEVTTLTTEVDKIAQAIDRLTTSTASAKFEAMALAAGMDEQEIAIRKTLIGMGLMTEAGEISADLTAEQRDEVMTYVEALRGLALVNEEIEATTTAAADTERARQVVIDRGIAVTESMRTAQEVYNDRLVELNELLAAGAISQETFSRAVEQAGDRLEEATKGAQEVNDAARELGMTFSSAFEDAIVKGNDLRDVMQGLLQDITRIFIRQQVTGPLTDVLGTVFSGMNFGVMHRGGMVGGPTPTRTLPASTLVSAPRLHNGLAPDEFPAILQKGEEVIPKGGRGGNSYFIDARGADAGAVTRMERALIAMAGPGVVERRAVSAVQNERRRKPGGFS